MKTNLSSLLTNEQKVAVLTTLKWVGLWATMDIADSDELLPKFDSRLNTNFDLLNFDANDSLLSKYDNEESEDLLFMTLNSIPANTKPWFVLETYMILSAEGNVTPRAMQVTLEYCEKIGVSEKMYLDTIQYAYVATGDFRYLI